jgi:hypothetical protein
MLAPTIFPTTQRSTSGKSRGVASSSHCLRYAKLVFAISFFVLCTSAVPSRLATSRIPPNVMLPDSAASPSMSLTVTPFQYLTTYVSGCDGRVSIGPSLGPGRTPAALVTVGLRSTGYSVKIRWSWNQKPSSSSRCGPKPSTTLSYPLATMKVSSSTEGVPLLRRVLILR